MDLTNVGALGDRADPTMRGSSIESVSILSKKDRALDALSDGEIDSSSDSRDEWDAGWLRALAHDLERAILSLETEVLDIGLARLSDPQPVEPEKHSES
jgi:hypothetical protein